jgi:predicted lipoprotein with Yx(FWY)xxD motif
MRSKIGAALIAGVLLFAACGDDDSDDDASATDAPTETTEAPEPTEATDTTVAPPAADAAVAVASTGLGDVIVDAEGYTLYFFAQDQPNTSNCTGGCLDNWPPAEVAEGFTVGDGLDQSAFGTITRSDTGATQLTVNGLPLYRFAADQAPGDTNGQGVGGVWYAAGADGNPIQ